MESFSYKLYEGTSISITSFSLELHRVQICLEVPHQRTQCLNVTKTQPRTSYGKNYIVKLAGVKCSIATTEVHSQSLR